MSNALVSIICINTNQGAYLKEAIDSVFNQTYQYIEVFLVDNDSHDDSDKIIEQLLIEYPSLTFIKNNTNLGICKAFNNILKIIQGKYVVDLAADDVLLKDRIEKQVDFFEKLPENYAIIFSNAQYINTNSEKLHFHYPIDKNGKAIEIPPSGDIFIELFKNPFICTPTQLMRVEILNILGGYDENLSYEDFDYWVRSSRNYLYYYQDEVTTLKRIVKKSITFRFYEKGKNIMLESSYLVLLKAIKLYKNEEEKNAIAENIEFNQRQAFFTENFDLAIKLYLLLFDLKKVNTLSSVFYWLSKAEIPVYNLYKTYLGIRYGKIISSNI